jgi:hypothetical protein
MALRPRLSPGLPLSELRLKEQVLHFSTISLFFGWGFTQKTKTTIAHSSEPQ